MRPRAKQRGDASHSPSGYAMSLGSVPGMHIVSTASSCDRVATDAVESKESRKPTDCCTVMQRGGKLKRQLKSRRDGWLDHNSAWCPELLPRSKGLPVKFSFIPDDTVS